MKKNLLIAMVLLAGMNAAFAYDNPFETVQESKARHSAENYNTYKQNNYQTPLGGYSTPLGDSAPRGTITPGYVNNNNSETNYYPTSRNNNYQGYNSRY